jgi:hypothetical protein
VLTELRQYLASIGAKLKLDSSSEKEILWELYTHFEDRVEELEETGVSEEEATKLAAECFGSPQTVAGALNEAHSSNNWAQAIVAALPHLLVALLFALRQWHNIFWLVAILGSIVVAVVYGWRRNKPDWFFSWLGYAILPLLMVGFILLILLGQALSLLSTNLPYGWWVWLAALVYFPIMWWLLIPLAVQTIRRDWLLGSVMVLPLPAIAGWFLAVRQEEGVSGGGNQPFLHGLEPWIALSFFTLAGIVILFVRLRQRPLKTGVLLIAGLAILSLLACSSAGLNFSNFVVLILVALFLLLGPALLGNRLERREAETWDHLLQERFAHKH